MAKFDTAGSARKKVPVLLIIAVIVVVAAAVVSIWYTMTRPRTGITMTPELKEIVEQWKKRMPPGGLGRGIIPRGGSPTGRMVPQMQRPPQQPPAG